MVANRLNAFLGDLRAADLLGPGQIEEIVRSPLADSADPAPLAKDLVQRGLLTSYQVNQLIRGHGKDLVLGPYRILDRLGEGGMGQVFKAYHKPLERTVALKVIRKERLDNPDAVKRFQREVQSTASLVHPNIITAYDAGQIGNTNYLAMEFVDGIDLSKLVKQSGALAPEQACEYIRQAACGLAHANEKGLVHRDIKPSNLLLSQIPGSPPLVKLLDLGLARLQGPETQETNLTRIGSVVGTPDFLAPEQAKNSSAVDVRADLYSLGCTFFYLLSGQAPYRAGSSTEVMLKHFTDPVPSLEKFRGDVPAPVQAIIKKLMAKKAADRFQTPAELVQALQPFCGADMVDLAGPPSGSRKKKGSSPTLSTTNTSTSAGRKTPIIKSAPPPSVKLRRKKRSNGVKRAAAIGVGVLLIGGALALGMVFYPRNAHEAAALNTPTNETTHHAVPTYTATKVPTTPKTVPTKPKIETKPTKPVTKPQTKPEKPPTKPEKPPTKPEKPPTKPEKPPTKPEKPPTKPEKPPDETATKKPPKPKRLAVPHEASLLEAEDAIVREHRTELNRTAMRDRLALGKKLLAESAQTKNNPARLYKLIELGGKLCSQGGSLDLPLESIDRLDRLFEIDGWACRLYFLDTSADTKNPAHIMRGIADKALQVADRAIAEDNYEAATKLMPAAKKAAEKSDKKTVKVREVLLRGREIAEMRRLYPEYRPAAEALQKTPNDPEANAKWGSFVCLAKGRWDQGLPLLARGDDAALKELANRDLAKPKDSASQVKLAEAWFAYAGKKPTSLAKTQALLRARHWYESAAALLPARQRTKIETRVKQVDKLTGRDALVEKPEKPAKPLALMGLSELIETGRKAYREARYAEAVQAYKLAFGKIPQRFHNIPGNRYLHYELAMSEGQLAMQQQKFNEAANQFMNALRYAPNDAFAKDYLEKAQAAAK